jgi:hypothetical protein
MLNKDEVLNFLHNLSDSDKSDLMSGYGYGVLSSLTDTPTNVVDEYGGEDQGSTYYAVWEFYTTDGPLYVKFYGWYASYDGATYEDFREVKPREVTKTEYV